jgi:hypothetical protein
MSTRPVLALATLVVLGMTGCGQGQARTAPVCDPSYPNVCIFPEPPTLSCAEIPNRNFYVRRPDPHNFDRNGNGRGCDGKDLLLERHAHLSATGR